MAYERLHWVESETPLSAENMNNIEDGIEELQSQKVDKVSGKGLSDQNYTAAEKTKLAGIEAGAEVNVQPDWNQSDSSADDFIKNKPGSASSSSAGFMSASDKSKLDGVQAGAQVNPDNATTSAAGLMSAADKTKLNGIATGAEVNQNAFSKVKVGSKTVSAGGKTDTLGLVAGSNVTLTPDATNNNVTIAATDTKYNAATTSAAGLMSASDKIKLDGIEAIKTIEVTASKSVTIAANSLSTGNAGPTFYSTSLKGKKVVGYKNLRLWDSSGSAAPIIPISMSDASTSTEGGVIFLVFNPTASSITLKDTSKCTILYV